MAVRIWPVGRNVYRFDAPGIGASANTDGAVPRVSLSVISVVLLVLRSLNIT
jgi:hypothetical protein